MKASFQTVDEYIKNFPEIVQVILQQIRETIKLNAPEAVESIAYQMPAYKTNGKPLIYFGGYKNHIGLYATPSGYSEFGEELSKYKQGKGSVQFPLNKPIPHGLVRKIVLFKVKENAAKVK
ncbi:iron chaperone [Segetibacter aerophilus]|nr:DUF1801 domain-containing protein [Segetibacter aerophilus]